MPFNIKGDGDMKYLIFILILTGVSVFGSEWAISEKTYLEGFSELEEKQIISIKDSVNSQPIAGATVEVLGDVLYSDKNGYVKLSSDKFKGVVHGYFPLMAKKNGYRDLNSLVEVELEGVRNKFFIMEKGGTQYSKLVIKKNGPGTVYLNEKRLNDEILKNVTGIAYGTYLLKRVSGNDVEEKPVVVDRGTESLDI